MPTHRSVPVAAAHTSESFRTWVRWHLCLLRIRGFGYRQLEASYVSICKRIDTERIDRLSQEVKAQSLFGPESSAKYLDFRFWIRRNLVNAARIGLHKSKGLRILDIGCGGGYFLAVCDAFGNSAIGVDLPDELLPPLDAKIYRELLSACGYSRRSLEVRAYTPLGLAETFDLIVAFLVCFNGHKTENEWSASEWEFFIKDIISHLSVNGSLWLELNENRDGYGDLQWYDSETLALFKSMGTVKRNIVVIPKRVSSTRQ